MDSFWDTIAAIATPCGEGGIAIIRVSGAKACSIVDRCFKGSSNKFTSLKDAKTHTVHHGHILREKIVVDEVLATVFRAAHSYTGEESVEISCHGGFVISRKVLETVLDAGARMAEPGEFTRRAFLNGKMDLTQAEAVCDLIHARTECAAQAASEQLGGGLSLLFDHIRDQLLQSLAHVEAYIDFPDEDISPEIGKRLRERLYKAEELVHQSLSTFHQGQLLRKGIHVAIVGHPNAGKSSLLNTLLRSDRAIVSPSPGTTRDAIEAEADIGGIPFLFVDTAGIRETENAIEQEGVRRSQQWIERSDLVLWVIDAYEEHSIEKNATLTLKNLPKNARVIVAYNKMDLWKDATPTIANPRFPSVAISCLTGQGIEDLKKCLFREATGCETSYSQGAVAINSRHRQGLVRCQSALEEAIRLLDSAEPIELLAAELHIAVNAIGELLGKTTTDDLLNSIFSQFCIGK